MTHEHDSLRSFRITDLSTTDGDDNPLPYLALTLQSDDGVVISLDAPSVMHYGLDHPPAHDPFPAYLGDLVVSYADSGDDVLSTEWSSVKQLIEALGQALELTRRRAPSDVSDLS